MARSSFYRHDVSAALIVWVEVAASGAAMSREETIAESGSALPQTLERAFDVLALFQLDTPEWSATEVSRRLGLTLPTASRFLRALESRGYLMRVEGRRYRLGFAAIELGSRALRSLEVPERLRPVLLRLARESGETCLVATLNEQRDAARVVDRVEGRDVVRISLEIGHTWPLHAGALAKAVLAHMPDRETVLAQPLARIAAGTLTDPARLRIELETIRDRGWARSIRETEVGAWGVAAAVRGSDGHPVASIGVVAPVERESSAYEQTLVRLLLEAVEAAQARLGVRPQRA
jgi:DNA-binding IclR family transcriptional regulator